MLPLLIVLALDIQPLGTLPDANVQTDLGPGNYTVDVSDKRSVVGCRSSH